MGGGRLRRKGEGEEEGREDGRGRERDTERGRAVKREDEETRFRWREEEEGGRELASAGERAERGGGERREEVADKCNRGPVLASL